MKRNFLLFVFIFILNAVFAVNQKIIYFGKEQGLKVKQQTFYGEEFSFSLNYLKITESVKRGMFFTKLEVENFIPNGEIGFPALPSYKQLIEIPFDAKVEVNILSFDEETINLNELGFVNPIIPMQPSLRKDKDPNTVPFYKNEEAYLIDNFITSPIVEVQPSGIARSVQLARLVICPFQYNPAKNTIKVFKNIQFRLHYKQANYAKTQEYNQKYFSPVFENQFKRLVNHSSINLKDQITQYPISYLIISPQMFDTTLQPFIQLKTRQGYKVTVGYTEVIGTTTTAIKSFITTQYTNGTPENPAPTYLLLVGDVAQVPAFSGNTGNHPTDTYYGTMDGSNDIIPDMYIGRISATTTSQLQAILDKIIEYEQYQMPDPSYLQYAVMIAGVDANYAPTYGNGQINYATQYYINSSNSITSHTYLYGSGSPIVSNSSQAAPAIKQNISDGVCFGNYTAHCSPSGWSDPSVNISDIQNFTNAHKYGLLIGNCCQSNKFDQAECFGEAILRAENKGAVAYIGASDYSYWDEDFYYSTGVKTISANPTYDSTKLGFYDRLFHSHGEPTDEWFVTAGQINYGGNLAVEQSGQNNDYYWEMYHLMGDPSMLPYMGIPTPLTASYLNSVPVGMQSLTVTTEPYAYVGLSYNNTWIDAKYTGTGTTVTLDLSSISTPSILDIVITKQNRQPHVGTVQIVPNNDPYVVYQSHIVNDTGLVVNGNVEYGEIVHLDVTLSNVGLQNANQVVATISCNNSHIHIIDSTEIYGTIDSTSNKTILNAFAFTVDSIIADQEIATFTITIEDDQNNTWISTFNIVLNAPVLSATNVLVDDITGNNNGRLDPGETATIKILTSNTGYALSPIAIGTLSSNSTYVTINTTNYNLGTLNTNNSVYAEFSINVDPSTPIGTSVNFTYQVDANGYTANKCFDLPVGLIVEDFESANFTSFHWDTSLANSGNAPWIILSSGNIYEGNYSARSGVITDNQSSILSITIDVVSPDTLSFYKRVSCEDSPYSNNDYWYDYLKFEIDGIKKGQWDGEIDWSREAYYLTTGTHTLKWTYVKDYSESAGDDAAFIDYVIFPPINQTSNIVNSESLIKSIIAYPNPCTDILYVIINAQKKAYYSLHFINQLGQKMNISTKGTLTAGSNFVLLNTSTLSSGIYYLQVKTDNSVQLIKITIIR